MPDVVYRPLELLRLSTVGSVDDGKSTLIGRLLYDSDAVFDDQLQHIVSVSRRLGDERTDLALLTDGLRAEREQRITIDVAYRSFRPRGVESSLPILQDMCSTRATWSQGHQPRTLPCSSSTSPRAC